MMGERDETTAKLRRIRHFALDLDGTLYRGAMLFDVTLPFLKQLRRLRLGYTFLTNNTSLSKADYVVKLGRLGIDAVADDIATAADPTIAYLRDHLPHVRSIAVLGTPSLSAEFERAGFETTWHAPQAVVVGFDTGLTYDRLCRAAHWINAGLPFVATHPDLVCPTDEPTALIDCGAICACLTAATGRQPVVLGKPEPSMLLDICGRHRPAAGRTGDGGRPDLHRYGDGGEGWRVLGARTERGSEVRGSCPDGSPAGPHRAGRR